MALARRTNLKFIVREKVLKVPGNWGPSLSARSTAACPDIWLGVQTFSLFAQNQVLLYSHEPRFSADPQLSMADEKPNPLRNDGRTLRTAGDNRTSEGNAAD
jgi:hypothetical protein